MPVINDKQIENMGGFIVAPDDPTQKRTFINDPTRNNDIQKETLERLGEYVSDVTNGKLDSTFKNTFGVNYPTNIETSLITKEGTISPIAQTRNETTFVDRDDIRTNSLDSTLRDPEPTKIGLNETWQRGATQQSLPNGHTLLRDATTQASPVKRITSAVISNNRFTSDNMMNANGVEPEKGYNPTVRVPNKSTKGTYNDQDSYNEETFDKLALIGSILSLRGSGEVGSFGENYDPISANAEGKALLPSTNQLMVERIKQTSLGADDVYARMADTTVPQSNMINVSDLSWGAMNNVYEPFTGMNAISMPILAATLTLAVLAVIEVVGGVASLISGKPVNAPTRHSDGRYVLGKWTTEFKAAATSGPALNFNFPPSIQSTLGIKETQHPFMKALNKGMFIFFGMDVEGTTLSMILGGVDKAIESPGYNAVVCRSILRSSLSIVDQMKNVLSSQNLISGVKNVLSVLEVIKRSKIIGAVNVFTTLGDLALSEVEGANEVDRDGIKINSEIESYSNDIPGAAVKKSKLQGINKLAWANNRTPSVFLMPSTVMGLSIASIAGNGDNSLGAPLQQTLRAEAHSKNDTLIVEPNDKTSNGSGLRIPQVAPDGEVSVESIERVLDAEYVPFYFHDLRTNEIVSFHSFLTALTEDYSPQWESSEAYGRVDKIKVYKSTDRRLNIGFWCVSTGQADFDDMWVKINKLITLVYPGYSAGRKITPENYNFTMPFSQIITSSPVIRLRIGDLIRSNYSKFNLSRIFGVTDYDNPQLNGTTLKFDTTYQSFLSIKDTYESMLRQPWDSGKRYKWYIASPDGFNVADGGMSLNIPVPIIGGGGEAAGAPLQVSQDLLPYYNVKPISKYEPGGQGGININVSISSFGGKKSGNNEDLAVELGIFELTPMSVNEIVTNWQLDVAKAQRIVNQINAYETSGKNRQKTKGRQFILPANAVKLQEKSIKQFWMDNNVSTQSGINAVLDFMSAKNNAIVKAFQETSGKGLAGVIESMSFDWNDQVLWETSQFRKAPNRVRVTMTFSPIHDISPGLDHHGVNRAPVYPIGQLHSEIKREKI